MIKYLFSVLVRMAALLRILLAHSPTLGLGDYMCCVHVKASKPSPPQSWSDCTIIPLTLSSTPPAMRPPFSQDAGCLLPDQQSSAVPAKVGPWVNLSACLRAHWITWELTLKLTISSWSRAFWLEWGFLKINLSIFIYLFIFRRKTGQKNSWSYYFAHCTWTPTHRDWHTCKCTLICSAVTHVCTKALSHTSTHSHTHTHPHIHKHTTHLQFQGVNWGPRAKEYRAGQSIFN